MASDQDIGRRKNAVKGTVKIESDKGWLRLRFSHQGKRYAFAIGLPASKVNRTIIEQKARQIELDILSGNFDSSLVKYKPKPPAIDQKEAFPTTLAVQCDYLFSLYTQHKAKILDPRTIEKYNAIQARLAEFFKDKRADFVSIKGAENFIHFLRQNNNSPQTIKDRLVILSSAWEWALKKGHAEINPWKLIQEQIKVSPKQMPKSFTKDEIQLIIKGFQNHPQYRHYFDFVRFLFGTGVRISEAIGLRWSHIADDFSAVWIGETVSRGIRKSTKTNKDRTIPLNTPLKAMLKARQPENSNPDDLVFPAPSGIAINDLLFRRRAWHKVLEQSGVSYRRPYVCRHSFISHCLDKGMNPVVVAQITGHDVQTLYKNYAGVVNSRPSLPEMWE